MQDFSFDAHIFKEGDTYVAYVPALDLSSCGATDEGTFDEILEEAGYKGY